MPEHFLAIEKRHALIAGCGFLGQAVADRLHATGWRVTAWTASRPSAERLSAQKPYSVTACDLADLAAVLGARERLPPLDLIIHCASSGGGGAEQYRRIYLEGTRHLLAAFTPMRLVFTSSTSVYGQTDGSWVDESSPTQPARETGRVLLEAESLVRNSGGVVARLSGLYGMGRSVLLDKLLSGAAVIEGDGSRWLNYIHRDDAAAALVRLAAPGISGGIYNVSDGHPLTQLDFYHALASHFKCAMPPPGPVDPNRKRAWTNKRVCNGLLRSTGWHPDTPSYADWAADRIPRNEPASN